MRWWLALVALGVALPAPHLCPDAFPGFVHQVQVQHRSATFGGYHSPFHSPAHLWQLVIN